MMIFLKPFLKNIFLTSTYLISSMVMKLKNTEIKIHELALILVCILLSVLSIRISFTLTSTNYLRYITPLPGLRLTHYG